ncbi:Uncharacterized protein TCM_020413 [Theobroma cacao]|uniref:Uncharacterized protein n=1 Tax=Theobroma cacao TaxID=3641 RepID=A0A061EKL5_THECC|nr:Uncharacterized protein TCM_020413 [Theobroma cacao]
MPFLSTWERLLPKLQIGVFCEAWWVEDTGLGASKQINYFGLLSNPKQGKILSLIVYMEISTGPILS